MSTASSGGDAAALATPATLAYRRPRATTRRTPASASPADEAQPVIAAFLRALADRVEQDPAFGHALLAVYAQSCMSIPRGAADTPAGKVHRRPAAPPAHDAGSAVTQSAPSAPPGPPLDPFALLRAHGDATLRARLGELDLASLRGVVRTHRLDPARISARWSARERLVDLIVEQVCARASLGRAFEHV